MNTRVSISWSGEEKVKQITNTSSLLGKKNPKFKKKNS